MDVAVIGLGGMGSRMAARLLAGGDAVTVWNRSVGSTEPLATAGASVAATPATACSEADAVITMLADPAALTEVVTAADGLAEGLRPGQVLLEMSTVGPTAVAELARSVPAGVDVVDAPVLGSLSEVEEGTLTIFVGGADAAFDRVRPLLAKLGRPIHVGPFGHGAAAKLVANATLLGTLTLLGESLALARGLGLDPGRTFEVLAATPLAAQAERRRPVVEGEDVSRRFRLDLGAKDAHLIVGEARARTVDVPLLEAAAGWFDDAVAAGEGEGDYSAIVRHIVEAV